MTLNSEQRKTINKMIEKLVDSGEVVIHLGTPESSAFIAAVRTYLPQSNLTANKD